MESFKVTEQAEQDCIHPCSGEVSVADLVREILSQPAKGTDAICSSHSERRILHFSVRSTP